MNLHGLDWATLAADFKRVVLRPGGGGGACFAVASQPQPQNMCVCIARGLALPLAPHAAKAALRDAAARVAGEAGYEFAAGRRACHAYHAL